jgi:sulfotransferase family protein
VIFLKVPAGRRLDVFPDDVFLVSYPRSGNTWSRFLVGNLVSPQEPITFANIENVVPDIYNSTNRQLKRLPRPRILKSHEPFDPRYKRLIYIVRDPRDVALSYYHFHVKFRRIEEGYPIEEYVPRFIAGEFHTYGSWGENVASWLFTRAGSPAFLLLRYEDILEDPKRELNQVAPFLGIDATPERLDRTIALSAADEMRKLEKTQGGQWTATRKTRQDKPFVRGAKSGEWASGLPPGCVTAIEAAWGHLMIVLGYKLVTRTDEKANQTLDAILSGGLSRRAAAPLAGSYSTAMKASS